MTREMDGAARRRSTRLRGPTRDAEHADEERPSKAQRRSNGTDVTVASKRVISGSPSPASDSSDSMAWQYSVLTRELRAQWDCVLQEQYALHVPDEFYDVFALALHVSPKEPLAAFVGTLGVRLSGPFELLTCMGRQVLVDKPWYLHGRFFMDPPEVVTVMEEVASSTGAHWGYFRDSPTQQAAYVVHTVNSAECRFQIASKTLFGVLSSRLSATVRTSSTLAVHIHGYEAQSSVSTLSLDSLRRQRHSASTATSLHGLGIVVPYDTKKRCGYRELPVAGQALADLVNNLRAGEDAAAKKTLRNLTTRATIANDECDFGTSLLLGLDLFTAGPVLQKETLQLLRVAYMLLGRKRFAQVIKEHVQYRDPKDLSCALHCNITVLTSTPGTSNETEVSNGDGVSAKEHQSSSRVSIVLPGSSPLSGAP